MLKYITIAIDVALFMLVIGIHLYINKQYSLASLFLYIFLIIFLTLFTIDDLVSCDDEDESIYEIDNVENE